MKVDMKGKKQEKKPTAAQLERQLKNALIHVDRTKDTQSIFFSDKGMRLTVNEDYALIATNYHTHVFQAVTSSGVSRPWLYTKRFVEIALENDCIVRDENGNDHYSYSKLMSILKEKEDRTEYNICWYIDLWFFNIFVPLYSIAETEASSFLVYESYMHNIARNEVILEEHKEPVTNKQFVEKVLELEKSFVAEIEERVVFEPLSDEERMKQESEALQEMETEQAMEAQKDGK